jgi:hypothetical protein
VGKFADRGVGVGDEGKGKPYNNIFMGIEKFLDTWR